MDDPNDHVNDRSHSSLPATMRTRLPLKRFLALIGFVGAFVIVLQAYSLNTGLRMSERYTPLIDATMEIKLEATTAHLWFEEILANARDDNIALVRTHLEQAKWYANAMLVGGSNLEGTFFPLQDPELRKHIEHVQDRLDVFSKLMERRWQAREISGPGTPYDQEFDQVFSEFMAETDKVETRLQELTIKAIASFRTTQWALTFVALIVMGLVAYTFIVFARAQNKNLKVLNHEVDQRKKIEEILRQQATTDSLTGLSNRRHITDVLQGELQLTKRQHNPFSLVLFDVDEFKMVNDNYGHETGDRVLQAIAKVVASNLREIDVFARWGGRRIPRSLAGY